MWAPSLKLFQPFVLLAMQSNMRDKIVNNKNDVPYGAGASRTPTGFPVNIDHHIPEYDLKLTNKQGHAAHLWKYLIIHEITEYHEMERNKKPYLPAHKIATAKEKQAVEADGIDWQKYTHTMDGYLSHIEHEKPANPPMHLYLKPYPHDEKHLIEKNEHAE